MAPLAKIAPPDRRPDPDPEELRRGVAIGLDQADRGEILDGEEVLKLLEVRAAKRGAPPER